MKHDLNFRNLEIKSIIEENGVMKIEGYAAIFNIPDEPDWRMSDILVKGCFKKTLAERKSAVKLCFNHDMYNLIGKIDEIYEDEKGLFVKCSVSAAEDDLQTKIREKIYTEMSFGYETLQAGYETDADDNTIRMVKEVKLWEVSVVSLPKHPLATFNEAKGTERLQTIEDEFDRLISMERNEEKKYNILMLKSLVCTVPVEPHTPDQVDSFDIKSLSFIQ
jgi:HK97 family phage prohead protease